MRSCTLPFPFFAIGYFISALLSKVFLLSIGIYTGYPIYYSFFIFRFLVADLIFAFILFFLFDIPLFFIKTKFSNIVYKFIYWLFLSINFFLNIYYFLMIKFYSMFGTFLSFGLFIQADHISSFKKGIISELTFSVFLLIILGSSIYFLYIFFLSSILKKKLSIYIKKVFLLSIPFFILITFSYFFTHKLNLYSLDKNPALEFIITASKGIFTQTKEKQVITKNNLLVNNCITSARYKKLYHLKPMTLKKRKKMNLVMIKLESTPYSYIFNSKYGKKITPNIHRIAQNSLLFTTHYCQEPASLKALYSILSGRYSYLTRDWKEFVEKAKKDPSLGDILSAKGYDTAYFTSGNADIYRMREYLKKKFRIKIDRYYISKNYPNTKDFTICYDDRILITLFRDFLYKKRDKTKPFFVLLLPVFPHHPYIIADEKFRVYKGDSRFERYKNSLHFEDYIIGKVYKLLNEAGFLKNTLFVIFSDHGEAFYQHPRNYIHSIYLYEENVHTILLFHSPELIKTGFYNECTDHTDIMPSILDILGYYDEVITDLNIIGKSILKGGLRKEAFFYTSFADTYLGLRDGKWKYILNKNYDSAELYDLLLDPFEENNLILSNEKLAEQFKKRVLLLYKIIR